MSWRHVMLNDEQYNIEYFSKTDVCRICWRQNANKKNIQNIIDRTFSDKIAYCLDIDLKQFNHINKICEGCTREIVNFYEFKIFCRTTDLRLRQILDSFETNKVEVKLEYLGSESSRNESVDNLFQEETNITVCRNDKKKKRIHCPRSYALCDVCCHIFDNEQKLSTHNSEIHGIESDLVYKCYGCDKWFKTRKSRMGHEIKYCKGLKDGYKCNICERYLPKRSTYECHVVKHLSNQNTALPEDIFKCKKCLKTFKSKKSLDEHFESDHRDIKNNYICDTCGKVFSRHDYLHKHKLMHAGIKRYNCSHCDFKATQRSTLILHIRKHTGERPYSCDLCPLRCTSSSNLHAHRKRHFGLKKYECEICNKKFGYKASLKEHIVSIHRPEQHVCQHCGDTFSICRRLRRHIVAKHKKLTIENGSNVHSDKVENVKILIV